MNEMAILFLQLELLLDELDLKWYQMN